jgi:hypothetical protein
MDELIATAVSIADAMPLPREAHREPLRDVVRGFVDELDAPGSW